MTKELEYIGKTVSALRKKFLEGKTKSYEWRVNQLKQISKMMLDNRERWEKAQYDDLRQQKFLKANEVISSAAEADDLRHMLKDFMKPKYVRVGTLMNHPATAYTIREPYGTVLVIAPWNYPISLVVHPLAGAIAAGNNVLLKPSELAPNVSALFAELIPKYLDNDQVKVIEGAVDETTELLKQRFDYIFYTGNPQVGKIVMRAAAEYLTPVTLELGGKSPAIVAKDANLDIAAKRLVWGKYMNCGQTCVAPDYLLVDKSIKKELIQKMQKYIVDFYGDNPQESADYSRIIHERHVRRIQDLVKDHGGEVLVGGSADEKDRYFAPTIIDSPDTSSKLMSEEIFGPVLVVLDMNSLDEAIDFINQREKPLALYLFSSNSQTKKTVMERTSSGALVVNDCIVHVSTSELPFGGVGQSGFGAYHGKYSLELFSHEKPVLEKPTWIDPYIRYPKYTDGGIKILNYAYTKFEPVSFIKKLLPLFVVGIAVYAYYAKFRKI